MKDRLNVGTSSVLSFIGTYILRVLISGEILLADNDDDDRNNMYTYSVEM